MSCTIGFVRGISALPCNARGVTFLTAVIFGSPVRSSKLIGIETVRNRKNAIEIGIFGAETSSLRPGRSPLSNRVKACPRVVSHSRALRQNQVSSISPLPGGRAAYVPRGAMPAEALRNLHRAVRNSAVHDSSNCLARASAGAPGPPPPAGALPSGDAPISSDAASRQPLETRPSTSGSAIPRSSCRACRSQSPSANHVRR